MQALEGEAIEHFRIQRRLARGGMSDIYLAEDTQTNHNVVIKAVHSSNQEYCERFRCEVQATAALQHQHILPALAHGEYEAWSYMISPYIEDGTLNDRLMQGPLSLRETDQILSQLAEALQFAHDNGIIHRDIKPSNILLRDKTHVLLADFGLARYVSEKNGLTVTGYLIGTPEYMAPELADEPASIKSDIYALGIVLYQLLTGQVPFKGSTPMGTYLKHIRENAVPPTVHNSHIPSGIEEVILRALEKNPKHRFHSANDLARAYHTALIQSEKRAQRQTSSSLMTLALAATEQLQPIRKIHWSLLGAAAALCFVFMPTVLGFMVYSADHQSVPAPAQIQGAGVDVSGVGPLKKPTVVVTTPAPSSGEKQTSAALIIQITRNDEVGPPPQKNTQTDNNPGNQKNGGDQGHANGGGHKGKK